MAYGVHAGTYPTYKITVFIHAEEYGPRNTQQYLQLLEDYVRGGLREFYGVKSVQSVEVLKQIRRSK